MRDNSNVQTHQPTKPARPLTRRALLSGSAVLAACAVPGPPLRELYRPTPWSPEQPPLIVIPGAFGSRLVNVRDNREIWPVSTSKLLFSRYTELAVEIDADNLEAKADSVIADDVLAQGVGRDFYRELLLTLEQAGGFQRKRPGDPIEPASRTYYVYAYDWRRSNVDAVRGLHSLIEQLRVDYNKPDLAVDIVAHSNGGLIARYYGRYGVAPPAGDCSTAACAGAAAIRRLITLGAPNLGTIRAALAHVLGEEIGLERIHPEVLATCPSVPELFPHYDLPWLLNLRGDVIAHDVFAVDTWRELEWSVFDPLISSRIVAVNGGGEIGRRYLDVLRRFFARTLDEGRAFMAALAQPAPDNDVTPFVFGADCSPTLARLVVEPDDDRIVARATPQDIASPLRDIDYGELMFDPGDLIVTRDSLLGRCSRFHGAPCHITNPMRIEHSVFLCAEHRELTSNPSFQNNLLYTLLGA